MSASASRSVVVGAGAGGLAAALSLAARGDDVLVLEAGDRAGGKMRDVTVGDVRVPGGPTVLTMKWAFDRLLAPFGHGLEDVVDIAPSRVLARHAWSDGSRLDLMADLDEAAQAIGAFAGHREAEGFRRFTAEARRIHNILLEPHMRAQRPSFTGLMRRIGARRFPDMLALRPYSSLWKALGQHFHDPRLRQLFGRYSTYTGSSPFSIPATLMLVAHVEREGVWRVDGGMSGLAGALRRVAENAGVEFRFGAKVRTVEVVGGEARAAVLDSGERIEGSRFVMNVDAAAVSSMVPDAGVPSVPSRARSYSALTWCAKARTDFDLAHHTVFFSDDYKREFDELASGAVPSDPTTYICAPDRDDAGGRQSTGAERLLMLVNAPANGDTHDHAKGTEQCRERMERLLERCGMELTVEAIEATTPTQFARLFPQTGGALYGRINDGPFAGFRRPGAMTKLPNLVLAGGSCHPGPGVPMATVSGMLAAEQLMAARASTRRFRPAGISGGISTGSARTVAMR